MRNELISFETAILAKEKGFKEKTYYRFIYTNSTKEEGKIDKSQSKGSSPENWNNWFDNEKLKYVSLPYQSFLQRWLREIHNIHIIIIFKKHEDINRYELQVHGENDFIFFGIESEIYKTYEKALEEGLIQGLNLLR